MSRLPDSFIDNLLAKTDLVALIGERLILKKVGKEYEARCPFHEEKSASFTVSPVKGFYHCFGCGAHGTAIKWLIEIDNIDFREAVEILARRAGLTIPAQEAPAGGRGQRMGGHAAQLLAACAKAAEFFREQLTADLPAQEYLLQRGITPEAVQRFGLGYAPNSWDALRKELKAFKKDVLLGAGLLSQAGNGHCYDKFRGRIIFPIHDRRGRVIAFGGRAISPETTPKYLNSPETELFQKGGELYGLSNVLQEHPAGASELVVVEGYTDVTSLHQVGITTAVGTLGTAVTSDHVKALFGTTDDVTFCFDGDSAGRRAAWRAVEAVLPVMTDGRSASFLLLPDGMDPDQVTRAEGGHAFRDRLASAAPLSEFLFSELVKTVDMATIEGRAKLAKKAMPLIEQIPEGVYRDLMRARLSELTGAPAPPPATAKAPSLAERTPIRQAIALLLRNPRLASQLPVSRAFRSVAKPGAALLAEMLDYANLNPDATTFALLGHFAGREEASALIKLADAPLPEDPTEQLADLRGALGRLDKHARRRRIELLQLQDEISHEEALELRDLLQFDRDPRRRVPAPPGASRARH
ncbi:DNA primase [Stenotrophomonas oahuensis]|uniref:DNA primase n=1 Tax=Stenotrophomonas oahuensis TaxID=3003271 RepID=A0ABY9YUZ2_9GAMM|nr:DNA primase [Stenotrophomonas sp. A5586]WNH54819.1 DNA primase [Stenotrophomonas sp. A5586]